MHVFDSPDRLPDIPEVSLPELVLSRADRFASKTAFVDPLTGRSTTFARFADRTRRLAGGLNETGFAQGDVLALMSANSPDFPVVFMAVALLGGITTTLNPTLTGPEVAAQARDAGATWLYTTPDLLERVARIHPWKSILTPEPAPGALDLARIEEFTGPVPQASIDPARDVVILPYSSGTTGVSKGVELTHRNLVANLMQISTPIFSGEDTIVGLAPFFHIYGLTVVLALGLYLGATDVILPRFEVAGFANAAERYRITHANLVPPLILALARHTSLDPNQLGTLRTVQSGAAPLPPDVAANFANRFHCRVLQGYGLTETSPVTHISPRDREDIPVTSIGPPVAGTRCQIRDIETDEPLGPGQRGELYIQGPQVMRGYLAAPEKTREMLDTEGWLRTGDLAWADESGNFYIADRVKELIKYKAYPVAPAELEALLVSHQAVDDAAVTPKPDATAGEIPKAWIVSTSGIDAGELMSWVAARVAPHKKIREVEFVDTIPKSASGKILRRVLIDRDRSASG